MATVSSVKQLDGRDVELYWDIVKETLVKIFEKDPRCVDGLRDEIACAPNLQQLLQYHEEPLHVVEMLAGVPAHMSPHFVGRYLELKERVFEERIVLFLQRNEKPLKAASLAKKVFGKGTQEEGKQALKRLVDRGTVSVGLDRKIKLAKT